MNIFLPVLFLYLNTLSTHASFPGSDPKHMDTFSQTHLPRPVARAQTMALGEKWEGLTPLCKQVRSLSLQHIEVPPENRKPPFKLKRDIPFNEKKQLITQLLQHIPNANVPCLRSQNDFALFLGVSQPSLSKLKHPETYGLMSSMTQKTYKNLCCKVDQNIYPLLNKTLEEILQQKKEQVDRTAIEANIYPDAKNNLHANALQISFHHYSRFVLSGSQTNRNLLSPQELLTILKKKKKEDLKKILAVDLGDKNITLEIAVDIFRKVNFNYFFPNCHTIDLSSNLLLIGGNTALEKEFIVHLTNFATHRNPFPQKIIYLYGNIPPIEERWRNSLPHPILKQSIIVHPPSQ